MRCVCSLDWGIVAMCLCLGAAIGLLIGNLTKRCPPYEDRDDG